MSVTVNGEGLTIEKVCAVACENEEVNLPEDRKFWSRLEKSRKFLMDYINTGVPTYGVTTDFGDSCHNQISVDKAGELQRIICTYHGIGLGPKFDRETGRAVVLARLNGNVKGGHSAIRPELAKMMVTLLNRDIIPVIPQLGSVGASGDLTPLSYLAAVIMGQRNVYYKGKVVPAMEAFKAEGIEPLPIEAKEGLAIMNGTSVMTAVASLAVKKAERIYNTGNFYGGHICASCDYMRTALANIADLSDKQAEVIIDGKFNGLTENLIPFTPADSPRAGLRLGFKAAQITISAIRGEVQTYCFPVSITSAPTEALNQDKVSMGTISARKLNEQIELVFLQFATHLLAAMQAVDLAGLEDFAPFTKQVHAEVRKISAFVEDDRVLDKEAEAVCEWLKKTDLFG